MRPDANSRFQVAKLRDELRRVHERLAPVTIEQLPWSDFIARYDRAGTLFYLDPPYDETEGYGVQFGRDDYLRMAEQLAGLHGRFLLSINDTPFIRATFAGFEVQEVETLWQFSMATTGPKRVTELIIRN